MLGYNGGANIRVVSASMDRHGPGLFLAGFKKLKRIVPSKLEFHPFAAHPYVSLGSGEIF